MKISVLTATYNRGELLENLYQSLLQNKQEDIQIQWLIMNDGSTDQTCQIIKNMQEENQIEIKYFEQENKGKMKAINELAKVATGELMVDCDSDDYFTPNAFQIIKKAFEENEKEKKVYALCFLKYDQERKNIGNLFQKKRTTMFDLYFREGEQGEKALVFYCNIRKQYEHELEKKEKFITEARLYHKMDEKYQMLTINEPIMICEYQKDGYTKNIQNQFLENPYGYYQYFKELLEHDMKGVPFAKRLYVIKHYILFSYLSKQYTVKTIRNFLNKMLYRIFLLPGILKSSRFKRNNIKELKQ